MSIKKPYSPLAVAIDLVSTEYNTTDPILISEKIMEDLDMCTTIHQVSDYLDVNKKEDFEKESEKVNIL